MSSLKSVFAIALLLPVAAMADMVSVVPEIDPSGVGNAIMLLSGLGLILRGRRK